MDEKDILGELAPMPPARRRYPNRSRLLRDLLIFEIKLVVDGVKDLLLAPLAALAAVADLLLDDTRRGLFLGKVIALGERYERWLNLYGTGRRTRPDAMAILDDAGSDALIDYLESGARKIHGDISRRRKPPRE